MTEKYKTLCDEIEIFSRKLIAKDFAPSKPERSKITINYEVILVLVLLVLFYIGMYKILA